MRHIPLSAITQKCKDEAAVRRNDPSNIPRPACLTQFATLRMTKSVSVTGLQISTSPELQFQMRLHRRQEGLLIADSGCSLSGV